MATLVLTVAGGLIGGPVGAAVGGLIGGTVDREVLFRPKGREGPRLGDLRVQTPSYGTQIPKLFGTMRVAGSVIWATDLIEHHTSQSGGKGRPGTTTYSYTASFAVALSARPIASIGRIWADGKLLRGSGGDFKTRTGFRLHSGGEDQAADPLIVAAEGAGLAPAHRGIAYAVFEDMELADFGNRIPSLTLEVVAEEGGVALGAIASEVGGGDIASEAGTPVVAGFAASGASVRAAVETLAGAAGGWFRSDPDGLILSAGSGMTVALTDCGAEAGRGSHAFGWRAISAVDQTPDRVTLTYYDPARDFQTGVQRAGVPGGSRREARVELPAAADADTAKGIAEAALASFDLRRERRTLALPWSALDVAPGARVTVAGTAGSWRIDRWLFEDMVLKVECVRVVAGAVPVASSSGRAANAPDLIAGETVVHAFELPLGSPAANPRIGIAAAGTGPGWRAAAILLSSDGGASWSEAGMTSGPAVLGEVVDPPGWGPATMIDRTNMLTVQLAHAGMALSEADAAMLAAGANLAMVGDELLQFGSAEPLGGGMWRLRELWRGRRGSEWAAGTQVAGSRFVLMAGETLAVRDLSLSTAGGTVRVLAQAAGDAEAAESVAAVSGASMMPPAPVHLHAALLPDGRTRLTWVRRARAGWDWVDSVDVPLGEEQERYRVLISGGGSPRTVETGLPELVIVLPNGWTRSISASFRSGRTEHRAPGPSPCLR